MFNFLEQRLPVAKWVEISVAWMTESFQDFFSLVQKYAENIMNLMKEILLFFPPLVLIILLTGVAIFLWKKKWKYPLLVFLGLLFIYNQGLWSELMNTLVLVGMSSLLSILIGIPLGILSAKSDQVEGILKPILDFMQTMPSFVYLIPAVAFFGIGIVPGVFASIIFSLPPTVRMTNLGIRQIPEELIEVSKSFGTTKMQQLCGIEFPLAKNTILAGINQSIMLALSMVVTASMIGAPGLGRGVLEALQRAEVGKGFVNGFALVILAIVIDRFTQRFTSSELKKKAPKERKKKKYIYTFLFVLLTFLVCFLFSKQEKKEVVTLSYVNWDTEIASTHVVGELLKDKGYDVRLIPLDNGVMWESIATGEADAMVSAWLPTTHFSYYQKHKTQIEDLGANLEGARIGLVVPAYMAANSIADLKHEANQVITGIEPGAGVVLSAQKAKKLYPNLKNWEIQCSSTGAMTVSLKKAIENKKDIVITSWSPHWMFQDFDLKYLEDPKGVMGEGENIHTIVRKGLQQEKPEVYQILKNFHWTTQDIEEVMLDIKNGMEVEKAARKWVDTHK